MGSVSEVVRNVMRAASHEDQLGVTVRGHVVKVAYAEKGYAILKCNTDIASIAAAKADGWKCPSSFSAKGSLADPVVGTCYEFGGDLSYDERWRNWQMEFTSYRTVLPNDEDGIIRYLVETAKWVGDITAKALVARFGADTMNVLKTDPDRVAEVDGISPMRAQEIRDSLCAAEHTEAAVMEVNSLCSGVLTPALVRKAVNRWGIEAATKIKANPYTLGQLRGVGFKQADIVYQRLGMDLGADMRLHAAFEHVLDEQAHAQGHTTLDSAYFSMQSSATLGTFEAPPADSIQRAAEAGILELGGFSTSLARYAFAERYIADKLKLIARAGVTAPDDIDIAGLGTDQRAAADAWGRSSLFALVGAPGTGKTYTLARIIKALRGKGKFVALAAPTGKAAKQMNVALGDCGGAVTIHSLLEPNVDEESGEFAFSKDESNPIDADVLVIDEMSMVDVPLMASLLRATKPTTRLLLVGDHYQLPSVGPGAVLRDVLAGGIQHVELKEVRRNAGRIVLACHAIKDGQTPEPCDFVNLETGDNWRHFEVDEDDIASCIEALVKSVLPGRGYDPKWDVQCISPTNERGKLSCENLNTLLRRIVNNTPIEFETFGMGVGDKVVRTKNGTAKGVTPEGIALPGNVRVVNGDLGEITEVNKKTVTVQFRWPDRLVEMKRGDCHLKLAYCLTCHKMQGSEVPVAIIPLVRGFASMPMVTREWIYTAISRAKQICITVGDIDVLPRIIAKVGNVARRTQLAEMMGRPQ